MLTITQPMWYGYVIRRFDLSRFVHLSWTNEPIKFNSPSNLFIPTITQDIFVYDK